MISRNSLCLIAVLVTLVLAASGCASKKYVRNQVAPVNQKLAVYQKQTNDKIATVWQKQERDMSQVDERISTNDQKLSEVAAATEQAQGTASRAMETSQDNATAITANSTAISQLKSDVANATNYQLVEKTDVMFGFNKSTLTPQAKADLDRIAAKMQMLPRGVVELTGFTDKTGSASYNLALSRKRAESVQRYLVRQNVPIRNIHIVGMGEEAPPAALKAELSAGNRSKAELNHLARRVQVQLLGAGEISDGTASRSQQ